MVKSYDLITKEDFVSYIISETNEDEIMVIEDKQILKNDGKTLASEGIDANYYDIMNYAVFALILIEEKIHNS